MQFKKFFNFIIIIIIVCLPIINLSMVSAQTPPQLPSSYWGTVKLDGENVSENEAIIAWMDGQQVASTLVEIFGENSVYSIKIPGGVDLEDSEVLFFLNDIQANESGIWISGTNTELNLTFTSSGVEDHQIFMPLILN